MPCVKSSIVFMYAIWPLQFTPQELPDDSLPSDGMNEPENDTGWSSSLCGTTQNSTMITRSTIQIFLKFV